MLKSTEPKTEATVKKFSLSRQNRPFRGFNKRFPEAAVEKEGEMGKSGTSAKQANRGTEEKGSLASEDYRQLFGTQPGTWGCYQVAADGAFRGRDVNGTLELSSLRLFKAFFPLMMVTFFKQVKLTGLLPKTTLTPPTPGVLPYPASIPRKSD